jgi:hypothetical protein
MLKTVAPEAVAFKKLKSDEADLVVESSITLPVYESPVDDTIKAAAASSTSCVVPRVLHEEP